MPAASPTISGLLTATGHNHKEKVIDSGAKVYVLHDYQTLPFQDLGEKQRNQQIAGDRGAENRVKITLEVHFDISV